MNKYYKLGIVVATIILFIVFILVLVTGDSQLSEWLKKPIQTASITDVLVIIIFAKFFFSK